MAVGVDPCRNFPIDKPAAEPEHSGRHPGCGVYLALARKRMLRSRQILPALLLVAFVGFAIFSVTNLGAAPLDVATFIVFGFLLAALAYILLPASGTRSAPSRFKVPRWVLVLVASYAAAFGLAMLLALAALPWVGFRGFEFLFGGASSWVFLLLGVLLFPFVRWRLR
jgi:hypothetical protein